MEREDSAPQMALAGHLFVSGDGDNGAARSVFGHQMGGETSGRQRDDGSRLALESSFNRCNSNSVSGISRSDNLKRKGFDIYSK